MPAFFGDLDDFVDRFARCTLRRDEWTHSAHLSVGIWHVARYGSAEALTRLRNGIRRLNQTHGTPNSATQGYHETITRAYVHLLSEFLDTCPAHLTLEARIVRLVASPLAGKDVLQQFYTRDTLFTEQARANWVEPDLAPLRLGVMLKGSR